MVPVTKDAVLIGTIDKYIAIRHSNRRKVAAVARVSPRTMSSRRENPETFRIDEIRRIFDYLKVPEEERRGYL